MAATLSARPRTEHGKGGARKLRNAGLVPAVMYGHGEESVPLAVPARELEKLLSTISVENTIIELQVEGSAPARALIREVQHHPARPQVLHVDFFHVHAGEKITVDVPVRLHGTPVGVRDEGGVLDQVLYTLHVECLPDNIPEAVDVDVANLGIGDSVHVSEVSLAGVRVLNDAELVIATVSNPTPQALPESPETELAIGEVEPELIRNRRSDAEQVPPDHGAPSTR